MGPQVLELVSGCSQGSALLGRMEITVQGADQLFVVQLRQLLNFWVSLVAQLVKSLPAMRETLVQFLGWEDTLTKG